MSEIKERPILFSAPMVLAILSGQKTQTRRAIRLPKGCSWDEQLGGENKGFFSNDKGAGYWHVEEMFCKYGKPGDQLWVREAFQPVFADKFDHDSDPYPNYKTGFGYAVTYPATDKIIEWVDADENITSRCRPSIHMPRWASRLTLEITNIRIEHLQDISEQDSAAEGFDYSNSKAAIETGWYEKPRAAFRRTWNQIYQNWDANPWVWVVEFKRIKSEVA